MKYWIGLLDGNDPRIDFVSELDENEPGYYKVDRKESFGYQYGIWIRGDQIQTNDVIVSYPDDSGKFENYRAILSGIGPYENRKEIEKFYFRHFHLTTVWIEVSERVWRWLEASFARIVLDLLTDPKLDYCSDLSMEGNLSSDERLNLKVGRHSQIEYTPRVYEMLYHIFWTQGVPESISTFLLKIKK